MRKNKNLYRNKIILLAILLIVTIVFVILIIKPNSTKEASADVGQDFIGDKTEDVKKENETILVYFSEEDVKKENEAILVGTSKEKENNTKEENIPKENKPKQPSNSQNQSNTTLHHIDTNTPKYYIKVNYQANVVTIYTKDSNGNYTVPYKAMVCSTGTATPTSGVYTIPGGKWDRYPWGQMIGNVWAQYYTRIKGSILFHSVPYTAKDKSTLEYWEYDKLGTTASAGCIRLTVQDAKWIYDNCPAGTQVEFYADSNPGPLGKPSAQKISNDSDAVRGWDPTDPSTENPWRTY